MAQKVNIELVDDFDGSPAAETVSFSLDGVAYEIELNAKNAGKFRETFAGYIGVARRVGSRTKAPSSRARAGRSGRTEAAPIRAWAKSNGFQVSDRGRVPATVLAAYKAAKK